MSDRNNTCREMGFTKRQVMADLAGALSSHTRSANWIWLGLMIASLCSVATFFQGAKFSYSIPGLDIDLGKETYFLVLTLTIAILMTAYSFAQASAMSANCLLIKLREPSDGTKLGEAQESCDIYYNDYLDVLKPSGFTRVRPLAGLSELSRRYMPAPVAGESGSDGLYTFYKSVSMAICYLIPLASLWGSLYKLYAAKSSFAIFISALVTACIATVIIYNLIAHEYKYFKNAG
jgi:hypothetical protein